MSEPDSTTELLHLALRSDWQHAVSVGHYDRSTRGVGLAEQGFIHASSDADQVRRVHGYAYRDLPADQLVLLRWPRAAVAAAGLVCRWEPGDPSDPGSEQFPHVYGGPVPVALTQVADRGWLAEHGLADLASPQS